MTSALRVEGLVKSFGSRRALGGLSFEIPPRAVAAFVGANGAGKTTTFSLIGRFFRPDAGVIEIEGEPLDVYRRSGGIVGILPQDVLYFEGRSVARHLILFARLAGLAGQSVRDEVTRVLRLVKLEDRASALVSDLSHGMKVRLGVAQALVGNPPVVLLDEPTAGLDPKMLMVFRECIEALRGKTTLVISSHDLGQLQQICDYVVMIENGLLVKQGPLKDLLQGGSQVTFRLDDGALELSEIQGHFPEFSFSIPEPRALIVRYNPGEFEVTEVNSRVLFWLFRHKVGVLGVESQRTLEQSYFEAMGKESEDGGTKK